MFYRYKDRIGTHYGFRISWWFSVSFVFHPAMWACSGYCFRRLFLLRRINYAAIDAYRKESRND